LRTAEAPANSKALIKNTLSFFNSRLVVTQCYSVVKNHPPFMASHLGGLGIAAQSSASSDGSFDRYRNTVVAVDAQLKAVDSDEWIVVSKQNEPTSLSTIQNRSLTLRRPTLLSTNH
jgi:hypothetical protein